MQPGDSEDISVDTYCTCSRYGAAGYMKMAAAHRNKCGQSAQNTNVPALLYSILFFFKTIVLFDICVSLSVMEYIR
jgi:hypothetical protein